MMTAATIQQSLRARMRSLAGGWEAFWFERVSSSNLALLRIAFGLLVAGWTVTFLGSGPALLSEEGIRSQPGGAWKDQIWSVLFLADSPLAVTLVLLALLAAALALTVGWHTRLAALLVFVGVMSVTRRGGAFVTNSGDGLLRIVAFYVMLAPCGASLSIDRWRRDPAEWWKPVQIAQWPMRLLQIQLSLIYLFAVWAKVRTVEWNDGTALGFALNIEDVQRFPVPEFVTASGTMIALLGYGTLAVELALALLIWNRTLRPYVLIAGLMLHLQIDLSIRVGAFSYLMMSLYLVFISSRLADALAAALARRLGHAAVWRLGARAADTVPTAQNAIDPEASRP